MAALYGSWDLPGALDLPAVATTLLNRAGGAGTPVGRACGAVAEAVARWGGHAYHSAKHHAEVATNVGVLAALSCRLGPPMLPAEQTLLLAAALSHDIHYDPAPRSLPRFTRETISADAMDAIAAKCGAADSDRHELRLLILATEPGFRSRLATLAVSDPGRPVPETLVPLAARPDLIGLAAMLSDADLLSSAGLTPSWHDVQRSRLERELGLSIPPASDLTFFDAVVGQDFLSLPGRYFRPNLDSIRQSVLLARAMAGAP